MSNLDVGETVESTISDISNSGNPICQNGSWEHDVIVITDDAETFETEETIEFIIKKKEGGQYHARLKSQSTISKPNYNSSPNIPIHHDGKYGESVGDTRSEDHAMKSVDERY